MWLGSGWFTTPASTAKNSSWDTTTTLSGKEVAWAVGRVRCGGWKGGEKDDQPAFLGSPGAAWNKGFSLETHGITEGLLNLRPGQKQGGAGGEEEISFFLYSCGRLLNL